MTKVGNAILAYGEVWIRLCRKCQRPATECKCPDHPEAS